jgi:hypothetical protein
MDIFSTCVFNSLVQFGRIFTPFFSPSPGHMKQTKRFYFNYIES